MTMDMQGFEWAQGLLRGLLIAMHDRLPAQSLSQLNELNDAAELPLALDVFLTAMEQAQVVPSPNEREQLISLAERMSLKSTYLYPPQGGTGRDASPNVDR